MHGQLSRRNPTTAQTLSVVARFYFRQLQKLLKLVEPPGMTTSDFATTYLVHILHLLPHAIRIKAFEALEHPESTRRDVNRNTRKKEKDHWWCVLIISGSYLLEFGPGLWELSGGTPRLVLGFACSNVNGNDCRTGAISIRNITGPQEV